jgi:AraC family transcriptional regulator, exoenzyme S synthesis regulatory protein ExsA
LEFINGINRTILKTHSMIIQSIPESFFPLKEQYAELLVYDFKMTENVIDSKVNLTLHMFSFLQTGAKRVQFADNVVEVNKMQSVLIKSGNCFMTELLSNDKIYFCKLFFFSSHNINVFFIKHIYLLENQQNKTLEKSFFVFENDDFIDSFVMSISSIINLKTETSYLLNVKFEEIMLYLSHKYGAAFISFIRSLASTENKSAFKQIVEANIHTGLNLMDIAFLSNMSLSTFKRQFEKEYNANPGKWFQKNRLLQAKIRIENGEKKPSQIYSEFGYTSLSNFSIAFKNEFGFSPKETKITL